MSNIYYKSAEEVAFIKESSLLVSKTLAEIAKAIQPGVKTIELDRIAEVFIRDNGGMPAFLNYNEFPYSICVSVNDQVVHGLPSAYELHPGDLLSIDCGVLLNKFYADSAYTFPVGKISKEARALTQATQECLKLGIEQAVVGNYIGDIGHAVQEHAHKCGFGVVKELVGHGVGIKLHEKPEVPNYGKKGTGIRLERGLVIAIEPMINAGHAEVKFWDDGWTVSTIDSRLSAHYEHVIALLPDKTDVLSTFSYIEAVLEKEN